MRWLSFHVHLAGSLDQFLVRFLAPRLEHEFVAGSFSRFFFIRYLEGGLHLRLRFLPKPGREGQIATWVTECVEDFRQASPDHLGSFRVEQHVYDRDTLYFGNTPHSVYAELLNEQTSWLALRLLCTLQGQRSGLMLVLGASLDHFLLSATPDRMTYLEALDASRQFAANTALDFGITANPPNREQQASFRALFPQVIDRSARFLKDDRNTGTIVNLMRRLRRQRAAFVGVHAMHLFCNKLGFSLEEEFRIFSLLAN
jgi:thiopeptide-type bacteriocin biosynthesis protein